MLFITVWSFNRHSSKSPVYLGYLPWIACDCLIGETFVLFNQQVKGNKRELIQLGTPIFRHIKEEATCQKSKWKPCLNAYLLFAAIKLLNTSQLYDPLHFASSLTAKFQPSGNIEPIPALLQGVIDHLIQWHLISDTRRPNSCIINFFDEVCETFMQD